VGILDLRATRPGPPVPGDLDRAGGLHVDDDDLLVRATAMHPPPHGLAEQTGRDRVLPALERHHRHAGRHRPGHSEGDRVRHGRDRMQPGPFLGEHLVRGPAGDPMLPGVDLDTERLARRLQLAERGVRLEQVGVLGDQVGLGDLHARLRTAFRGGVGRDAGVDRHPVEP